MRLEHSFTVPVPVDEAWRVLLDVERIAPCLPGATVDSVEGEEFKGRVKVKVGPIQVSYAGTARFAERDEAAHRAVISASGKESRGSGTARMTVTATLSEADGGSATKVDAVTDLAITGKPAQFGRGVMADVGGKLLGQFADCLAAQLGSQPEEAPVEPAPAAEPLGAETPPVAAAPDTAVPPAPAGAAARPPASERVSPGERPTPEAIDLLGTAAAPVLKRIGPILGGAALLGLIFWLVRRRR